MFGSRLKDLRKEKGITQKQLADMLKVGRPTIAGYETKGKEPDFDTVVLLADYFGVTVDYMLGRDETRKKPAEIDLDGLSEVQRANFELLKALSPEEAVRVQAYIQGLRDARKG